MNKRIHSTLSAAWLITDHWLRMTLRSPGGRWDFGYSWLFHLCCDLNIAIRDRYLTWESAALFGRNGEEGGEPFAPSAGARYRINTSDPIPRPHRKRKAPGPEKGPGGRGPWGLQGGDNWVYFSGPWDHSPPGPGKLQPMGGALGPAGFASHTPLTWAHRLGTLMDLKEYWDPEPCPAQPGLVEVPRPVEVGSGCRSTEIHFRGTILNWTWMDLMPFPSLPVALGPRRAGLAQYRNHWILDRNVNAIHCSYRKEVLNIKRPKQHRKYIGPIIPDLYLMEGFFHGYTTYTGSCTLHR